MKINEKILSLPPYISTAWSNISTVRIKDNQLLITLIDGNSVQIPSLPNETIELIFKSHADYLENITYRSKTALDLPKENRIQIGFGSIEGTSSALMQHDPSQSDSPPIPPEVIEKISSITKILAPEDLFNLPAPEPNCNCFHCQLIRAINSPKQVAHEEIVADQELEFSQWDIKQVGVNLFSVTSRLDKNEKYTVFLGEPIGCNCGQQGCEHIVAVLKT